MADEAGFGGVACFGRPIGNGVRDAFHDEEPKHLSGPVFAFRDEGRVQLAEPHHLFTP